MSNECIDISPVGNRHDLDILISNLNFRSINVANLRVSFMESKHQKEVEARFVVDCKELTSILNFFHVSNDSNIDSMTMVKIFQLNQTCESWVLIIGSMSVTNCLGILESVVKRLFETTGKLKMVVPTSTIPSVQRFQFDADFHYHLCGSLVTIDKGEQTKDEVDLMYQHIIETFTEPFPQFQELLYDLPHAIASRNQYILQQCQTRGSVQCTGKSTSNTPYKTTAITNKVSQTMKLPIKVIARLIGKNGVRIRDIRSKTTADIIIQDENTRQIGHFCPIETDVHSSNIPLQSVVIIGTMLEVQQAIWLISQSVSAP